jgi:choline dehydrogenase-like flavoprotein
MQRKLYRDMGATLSVGNVGIPIPIGRSVGGTTTINSGTCYRPPARIFDKWSRDFGLPLDGDTMAQYYQRVEGVLEVAPAQAEHLGGVARVIARGCEALGWHHHGPLRRNAPACDGQGVCCFGCPTDAKRSTNVSYVPLALKAGAQLFTGLRADEIIYESGRAVGVIARAGATQLTVRARAVVVACGALLTPLFLERNGVSNKQLGRNLSIHPAIASLAQCDELIDAQKAIPQGYAIEELHAEGILFEGAFAPLDVGAASFPILGKRLVELLEDYRRIACFGCMIEDTSRGRVRRGPGGRPFITYWLNDHDVARLKRGVEAMARVFFAGGARRVLPIVNGFDEIGPEDLPRLRAAKLSARDFEITAYHPLGTARLSTDASTGVCDADHQVHGVPGLYVADGSVVPSSPAVNPQLTIMALATRAADRLADKLS